MASFDTINYTLRPNKGIERWLAFNGLQQLKVNLDLKDQIYIGMGSIWFADFLMAHKVLGISDMISFESNEIGFARAKFNRPFRTVRVEPDRCGAGLIKLYEDASLITRPWVIWLDYDSALSLESIDDIRSVIESAPPNSVLMVTFSATGNAYGKPAQRKASLKGMMQGVVPDDLTLKDVNEDLPETLANLVRDFMISVASSCARPGKFVPAFRLIYTDSVTMVTVGGVLPSTGALPAVKSMIANKLWPSVITSRIATPPLTVKEASVLQALLPSSKAITRSKVQKLGFDLDATKLASFQEFYLHYPSYAQIVS